MKTAHIMVRVVSSHEFIHSCHVVYFVYDVICAFTALYTLVII